MASIRETGLIILTSAMLLSACGGGGGGSASGSGGGSSGGGGSGGGGSSGGTPAPNQAPTVAMPNPDVSATNLHFFSYDATQGGTTFDDLDGDSLTYEIQMTGPWDGFSVSNGTISGTLDFLVSDTGDEIAVIIRARDGRGGLASDSFTIFVSDNSAPVVVNPNLALVTTLGASVNYDLTQAGTTFVDADGDILTYEVEYLAPSTEIDIYGTSAVGALMGVGAVGLEITAHDGFGKSASDVLIIAVAADYFGEPALPGIPYIYADDELPLPYDFRGTFGFRDTTPADNPTTNAGAALGRVLFYDRRLSITNTLFCGSCHEQSHGFATPNAFDVGVVGGPLTRNSMALSEVRYNAYDRYFADFRAESLEGLAFMPIQDPRELGMPGSLLAEKLSGVSFYPPLFEAAFGSPDVTEDRISRALAQFLRSLISYNSKYDEFFADDDEFDRADLPMVFTSEEIEGFDLFIEMECRSCHDSDVQVTAFPTNTGLDAEVTDPGLAGGGEFRSASLRNIEFSGPYMHDGRFATLREVIDHYDHGVIDNEHLDDRLRDDVTDEPMRHNLTEEQKLALEAFLLTLSDETFLSDPKFSDPFP